MQIGSLLSTTYEVGQTRFYTTPSQVANLVGNGDTVAIDAGIYLGDVAAWYADNLVLMGVGGKAHLKANGNSSQGKAIWVIAGNNTEVIDIEFSECEVADLNGAGIRQEGTNLTIRHCYFHHNENGILTTDNINSDILIEHSEFAYNGNGIGTAHNLYINNVKSFTFQYSYSHHAEIGHNIKSRAQTNYILYNRIMDEGSGNSSMLIDFSNGGESVVKGNILHQGPNAENKRLITFGTEGLSNAINELYLVNNTLVNNRATGEFVFFQNGAQVKLINNIFAGVGTVVNGSATLLNNVNVQNTTNLALNDEANYDYSLTDLSTLVINQGTAPGFTNSNYSLAASQQYFHPVQCNVRLPEGSVDIGAYEYNSNVSSSALSIQVSGSQALCENESTTLSIPVDYHSVLWSNGQQNQNSIIIDQANIYTVTATNSLGVVKTACKVIPIAEQCSTAANKVIIEEKAGLTTSNYPVQLARPFKKGEIQYYPQALVDGLAVLTQAKVQTRWEDGTVKHAILNFIIPQINANETIVITFQNQVNDNSSGYLSVAEMLGSAYDFDAKMELENAGTTITASARDILTNGDFEYWLQGSVATSILLGDHSVNRSYDIGFDTEQSFRPLFYVTFWHTTKQVDIRFVGEISNTEHLQDMAYSLDLLIGNNTQSTVYTKPNFTHHGLSRWTKRFWLGGEPSRVNINHYLPYLVETTLIPNYDPSKVIPESVIISKYETAYNSWLEEPKDINDKGNWTKYMPTTGGRQDIGPYPTWITEWLYTGDWRMLEKSAGNADLAGAWPMHIREGNNSKYYDLANTILGIGKPISISDRASFWFGNLDYNYTTSEDRVTPVGPITNGDWVADNAHQPDPYSALYMLTGDYWYWEQLNFWASHGASNSNGAFITGVWGRGPTGKEGGIPGQIRSMAWLFRTRVRTALLAPDDSPEKDHFTRLTNDAIAIWEGQHNISNTRHYQSDSWNWGFNFLGGDDPSPLYHWYKGSPQIIANSCLDLDLTCSGMSTWEVNFLLFALGRGEALGFESELLRQWNAKHVIGALTHPDYDPYLIASYREPTLQEPTCEWFTSWSELRIAFGNDCEDSETWFNYWKNNTDGGYTNIALTASSYVTDLDKGDEAWNFMASTLANPLLDDNPKWAIKPAVNPPILQMKTLTCGDVVSSDIRHISNRLMPMESCGSFVDKGTAGIWYRIIGTGNTIALSTCSANSDFDTQLAVFDDCITFNCVTTNNNDSSCSIDNTLSTVTFESILDTDYYIFINGREVTDKGVYELSVDCIECSGNTSVWTGTVNSDWNVAANWNCGIPNISTNVFIPNGTPPCILSAGQIGSCLTIDVGPNDTFIVEKGAILNVLHE